MTPQRLDRIPLRPRVLIVEDEALVMEIATEELEEAGFDVVTAPDGDAACAALQSSGPFDLLFTDIRMPGQLNGWAVAVAARRLQPAIAVIYATGFASEPGEMVSGSVLLRKPYRLETVVETARRLGVAFDAD